MIIALSFQLTNNPSFSVLITGALIQPVGVILLPPAQPPPAPLQL